MKLGEINNMKIRPIKPEDLSFIYSTWSRGQYHGYSPHSVINKQVFFKEYSKITSNILKHPSTHVYITCLPDAEDIILGYVVIQNNVLHWIYVKQAWRNKGISKLMLEFFKDGLKYHTGITDNSFSFLSKLGLTYNPFLLYINTYE